MSQCPFGTPEFRLTSIPATDTRHRLLTEAQLDALRSLINVTAKAVSS